ncbi:O-fucosyltransferase family protein [Carboxylicivirga linearis]|uniref:Glycosyl transferase family 11 n=1 Tax=Carboxylicivirga linearis TaxID=1628157 RepID=A0ABS5JRS7_9BACT|nr:hypothetical protein [Carboxylicivirga linearis]MBS2097106.1 hypothetical protein [Carboxylicivirga linearis]
MKIIYLVPFGGLANRLRVIASAIEFSKEYNFKLKVFWINRPELNSSYDDLLCSIPNVEIISKKNNILWRALIHISSHYTIYSWLKKTLLLTDYMLKSKFEKGYFDIESEKFCNYLMKSHKSKNWLITCRKFYNYSNKTLNLFVPQIKVQDKVDKFIKENIGGKFIAVHIRRTDNSISIENSPLHLFEAVIEKAILKNTKILVCTDSSSTKQYLKEKYSSSLVIPESNLSRNSKEGITDAFVEFILLSNSLKIYASQGSTFSLLASEFKSIDLEIVSKTAEISS